MKNNWQKDIHDRLGNYEKDAPKGLWEDIRKGTTDENGGYMHGGRPFKTSWLRRTAYPAAAASFAHTKSFAYPLLSKGMGSKREGEFPFPFLCFWFLLSHHKRNVLFSFPWKRNSLPSS